ncbi:MAG: DUF1257 domain-containing protein [Candidatus Eremiobacteraeota bacterium]|nr:DUF1257 domain-containing protein [Candidatus Eremiobacteraeota bacterium]
MSHFTRVKTRIRDKMMLIRCLEQMGYEVNQSPTKIKGMLETHDADLKIQIQGHRDVGFVRNDQGAYDIVADWYGVMGTSKQKFSGELETKFREMENEIRRQYARETILDKLKSRGFTIVEEKESRKTVKIVARRWA